MSPDRTVRSRLLGLSLCGLLTGCALSLRPLERNTGAFAAATATATHSSESAYEQANRLHEQEQVALAVLNFDREPSWNPAAYAKPLLSPAQLAARTATLAGLQQYAEAIASLGSRRDAALSTASNELGGSLQALSQSVATSFATALPNAPTLSGSQAATLGNALAGLAAFLRQREIRRKLPDVLAAHDPDIAAICAVLVSDIGVLRSQADRDYLTLEEAQDRFIRDPASHLSPTERRAEIARLPEMVRAQQSNDALLAQLAEVLHIVAATHHALTVSARDSQPPAAVLANIQQLSLDAATLQTCANATAVAPTPTALP